MLEKLLANQGVKRWLAYARLIKLIRVMWRQIKRRALVNGRKGIDQRKRARRLLKIYSRLVGQI